jgi:hypothetical protein
MKTCLTISLAMAVQLGAATFAQARPPTVTNSPGYDARLKESRSAPSATATPAAPVTPPAPAPKHKKKKPTN